MGPHWQGVGPATASAVLSMGNKHLPFMSDEAIAVSTQARADYSLQQYLIVASTLQGKAERLSSQGGKQWCARDVERALWSAHHDKTATAGSSPAEKAVCKAQALTAGGASSQARCLKSEAGMAGMTGMRLPS